MNTEKQIKIILESLLKKIKNIKAIALISEEGLPIYTIKRNEENIPDTNLAVLTASASSLIKKINTELDHGEVELFFIQGRKGNFLKLGCGTGSLTIIFDNFINYKKIINQQLKKIKSVIPKLAVCM